MYGVGGGHTSDPFKVLEADISAQRKSLVAVAHIPGPQVVKLIDFTQLNIQAAVRFLMSLNRLGSIPDQHLAFCASSINLLASDFFRGPMMMPDVCVVSDFFEDPLRKRSLWDPRAPKAPALRPERTVPAKPEILLREPHLTRLPQTSWGLNCRNGYQPHADEHASTNSC